ncbi:MAG TPA: rhomboid family intramembrane serine protease [Verrucomicrobiae bacterium]|nr:rhomboid family intramembrane serine protease [Verrucomicrobiae bacterium]
MPDADHNFAAPLTRLPTPSRQKAMDWSLVLASQGIPHSIASPDDRGEWTLHVASAEVGRAAQAIRQYERENRTRPWQQTYLAGRIVFDWSALIWVAALVGIHVLTERHPAIAQAGVMHGTAVTQGEWWRLVTATELHADWAHLAGNLSLGLVLLGLVMGRWGTAVGMLAALLAGIGGNAANWLCQPDSRSLGASTVVMGCIGLLATSPHASDSSSARMWRGFGASLGGAILLFLLLGLDPRADVLGHAGGFVTGIGLAALFHLRPQWVRARRARWMATLMLVSLAAGPWLAVVCRQ